MEHLLCNLSFKIHLAIAQFGGRCQTNVTG